MVVGAAGDQPDAALGQFLRHRLGVGDDLVGVAGEIGLQRLAVADGFGGDDMHERPALHIGEHGEINLAAQLGGRQNHPAAGAAQGFLRGGSNNLGVGQRRRMRAAGHQPGNVRHIHHQPRAHGVGDGAKTREVQSAGIAAASGHDELGLMLLRQLVDLVVVNGFGFPVHAVGDEVVELAGEVDAGAVGEMAAHIQLHPQHGIAGFQDGEVGGHIGLRPAVGLDIGVFGAEQFPGAVDGEGFDHIHKFAAAVVAASGVALGVLVAHQLGLRLHHGFAGVVFGGDEDDGIALAAVFAGDSVGNGGVKAGQQGVGVGSGHRGNAPGWLGRVIAVGWCAGYNNRLRVGCGTKLAGQF